MANFDDLREKLRNLDEETRKRLERIGKAWERGIQQMRYERCYSEMSYNGFATMGMCVGSFPVCDGCKQCKYYYVMSEAGAEMLNAKNEKCSK